MRQKSLPALFALLFVIGIRASVLEYTDLVDPTESRYASVAQQMVLSGDWITPKLPMRQEIVPYLGKPPFHFWLTALSYKIFSIDEWSTRFPSFLCAIGSLLLMAMFSLKIRRTTANEATLGALIAMASPMFFLLSGASAVDMTLTFCTTLSLVMFSFAFQAHEANELQRMRLYSLLATVGAALGVLTKGPVALILVGLPVIGWLLLTKRLAVLRSFPWILMTVTFLLLVIPWFVLCERDNPGFLKYFIWSENVGRYLVHNYGDRYGTGHTHPRGFVWVMLTISFLPWSLVLFAWLAARETRQAIFNQLRNDRWLLLAFLSGIAPAVFFTFVRQLHIAYVVPGLPGLALFVAGALNSTVEERTRRWLRSTVYALPLLFLGIIGFAVAVSAPLSALAITCGLFISGVIIAALVERSQIGVGFAPALVLGTLFVSVVPISAEFINERKSTEQILRQVAEQTSTSNLVVGVAAGNTYSQFWVANVSPQELGEPLKVVYVNLHNEKKDFPNDVLVKQEDVVKIPEGALDGYTAQSRTKKWVWFHRDTDAPVGTT